MNTFLSKITLLLFGLFPCFLNGQIEDFYHLKSYNHFNDIAVDSQYIWAATRTGIVQQHRLTGEICGIFNESNSPLKSEHITAVSIAPDGKKWFGTENGFTYSFDDFDWVEEDSLVHKIVDFGFMENEEVVTAVFEISHSNYCGLNLEGTYTLFQQENGELWSHYRNSICQGSTGGCSCHKFHQELRKWNGSDWEVILQGEEQEVLMSGFVVDGNDHVWMIKDTILNHFQFLNNELIFVESIDLGIGQLNRIKYESDDKFWIVSSNGMYVYDGNSAMPVDNGLNGNNLGNLIFDANGNVFGFNEVNIYQYINEEWELLPATIKPSLRNNLTFAKNGNVWFAQNEGMTLYNNDGFQYFTADNSVLTIGTNEIIHADSQSRIWVNKLDENEEYRLFLHDGQSWSEIDESNSNLTSLNFSDIVTDSLGRVWFTYANPMQDSVAQFDAQQWTNFSTLDSLNAAFFVPTIVDKWFFSEDLPGMLKIENGDTTAYPIDISPFGTSDFIFGEDLISQDGYAWVLHYNPFTGSNSYTRMLHFNGESWVSSSGWYLQTRKYAFTKGSKAWFFNEDTVPGNGGSYGSGHYYDGSVHTEINYSANCGGETPIDINIIDLIEYGESYLMLCDISMFTLGGASSSVCSSKYLIKMTNSTFEVLTIENQEEIYQIELDLNQNIWAYRFESISTNRLISPTLETFSKPAFCNSGRALACITSGGLPPFDYLWNDGTTNPLKAPINPGSYSVTVTDVNANTQANDLEIGGDGTFIEVQAAITPISCPNEADGEIEVLVSGGTPPYQYVWSNGAITPMIEALAAGIYELTVTDAGGCDVTESYNINEPQPITINADVQNVACNGGTDGAITVVPMGGQSPYAIIWSDDETSLTIDDLGAGIYHVTVTDGLGCISIASIPVTEPAFSLSAFFEVEASPCFGENNGVATLMGLGGTPPYQYLWEDGTMGTPHTELAEGDYLYTVTDAVGCIHESIVFINESTNLELTLNATNSQVGQSNGSITTNLNNGNPPYTYLWNTGEITQDLTDIPGGNYSVTVTDSNGCTAEQSKFLLDVATGYEDPIFSKTSGNFIENAVAFQHKQKTILEERNTEISIYPNPFGEAFFIDFKNNKTAIANLEIYNILGQKMTIDFYENLEKRILKIGTKEWSSGAYFVHYQVNGQVFIEKIVKQ